MFGFPVFLAYYLVGQTRKGLYMWLIHFVSHVAVLLTIILPPISLIIHLACLFNMIIVIWDIWVIGGRLQDKIPVGEGEFGNSLILSIDGLVVGKFIKPIYCAAVPVSHPADWIAKMKELNIPIETAQPTTV
jgi:hypothetical protein